MFSNITHAHEIIGQRVAVITSPFSAMESPTPWTCKGSGRVSAITADTVTITSVQGSRTHSFVGFSNTVSDVRPEDHILDGFYGTTPLGEGEAYFIALLTI